MENLGIRLKNARKKFGLTQVEAARLAGVSDVTWRRWEDETSDPGIESLEKFARSVNIDVMTLIVPQEGSLHYRHTAPRSIPIYATVHAGNLTQWIPDEPVIGKLELDITEPDAYSLRVSGTSMYPEIQEGDCVVCAPHRPFVSGKIFVAVVKSEVATVKRVFKRSAGFELIPTNPEFSTQFIPNEDIIRLDRVIQIRRDTQ